MSASKLWSCTETVLNGGIKLFLYSSKQTKLRVAVGEVPGPMVHGAVSFVTEADSDDGLPHTLEHLVFMGSKKYPFKGVLDIIANRCLADGTNAWTDTDHTAYTLSTVGSDGFLKVLPVYINHLLTPMLTASQFATEVHHITGEGNDAGVVYSEMQDHESEMESIMDRKTKEVIYPPFNPYAVDTGGRLKNLRESCTLEKVRDYHKKYYHLSNMVVTVCGIVNHDQLLDIMKEVENEHIATNPEHFPKPFSFTLPEIKESTVHKVECPTDDASRGAVEVAWFAHHPSDLDTHSSLHVLFDYLSNTSVSPLQKDFILLEDPLASSVSFHIAEGVKCDMRLNFTGVPVEKLEEVAPKFFDKTVREHLEADHWDMERMGYLIDQSILNELVKLETNAPKDIMSHIIGHQLFDNEDVELLKKRTNEVDFLKKLKSEPASYWVELVKKYFTSNSATVIGVPDEELVDKIAKEEEDRIAAQCKKLGEEGLEEHGRRLEEAIKENTANHPSAELLDQLIVKELEAFDRFPVQSLTSESPSLTQQQSTFLSQFPFHANLHNCPTKFVEMFLLMDASNLSIEDRSLLFLYTDLLFESPAIIDGVETSADDVAKLFTKDLIDHSIQVGVSGLYDRFVNLRIKVGADKYPLIAKWAQIFTQGIVFDPSRVQMCAQKLAGEARDRKRDGCTVASTAVASMVYENNTNCILFDELVLEKLHEKISKEAVKNPKSVIAKLENVRSAVFSNGINVHFIADVDGIDTKLMSPDQWTWIQTDPRFGPGDRFNAEAGENVDLKFGKELLIGVGGSESSFIYQTTFLDANWNSEVLIPTMIFGQYLSQCEGPLWRAIRGDGLAYGANVFVKADRKQITLSLYRCAQPALAYERTRDIIRKIVESGEINEAEFEGAKRSTVFELMKREGTVSSAAKISILNNFRQTPHPYNIELCRRIWNLTSDEMVKIGGPPMARLFDDKCFVRSIAVHPSKLNEMKKAFPGSTKIKVSDLQFAC
uniref:Presequence protease, mitochondrial n=1 Tax=Caenorhabditis tropicalis TaxID=1561998 RepID=A0A1I7U966_9PELO